MKKKKTTKIFKFNRYGSCKRTFGNHLKTIT